MVIMPKETDNGFISIVTKGWETTEDVQIKDAEGVTKTIQKKNRFLEVPVSGLNQYGIAEPLEDE